MKCCPSGEQVFGICGCCPTCAKAENESCGGLWGMEGKCATGFDCKQENESSFLRYGAGICTKANHHEQSQTQRSDNPEWHKSVPTCDDTPTFKSAKTSNPLPI